MNCSRCNKDVSDNSLATLCPHCGSELPLPIFQSAWVSWPKFFTFMFTPAIGCFLAIAINIGGLAVILGMFGSLIGGLVCAHILMNGVNSTGFKKAMVHIGLIAIMCSLTMALCFLGCTGAGMISNNGL